MSSNEEDSFDEEEEELPKPKPIVRAATQKLAPKKHLPEQPRPRASEAPKPQSSFPNRMATRVTNKAKESESEDDEEEEDSCEEDYESEEEDSEEDPTAFKLKPLDPSKDFNPDGTQRFQVRTKLM